VSERKSGSAGGEGARGGRTRAREVLFRALFEADLSGDGALEVLELSFGRFRFTADGRDFARRLAEAADERRTEVDHILDDLLERWSLTRVSTVVRAILRLGVTELLALPESPALVVLNEAIRLAHRYGEEDSGSFVNGVLDAAARRLRPGELPEAIG
jgi:N utilization substance protein B